MYRLAPVNEASWGGKLPGATFRIPGEDDSHADGDEPGVVGRVSFPPDSVPVELLKRMSRQHVQASETDEGVKVGRSLR